MNEELICQVVEKAVREAGKAVMTLETAKKLIDMVEKKAEEMGIAVIIAVADKAARPVAIHCMDDAYIASFDIALNKAYTSAGLKMSTAELSRLSPFTASSIPTKGRLSFSEAEKCWRQTGG